MEKIVKIKKIKQKGKKYLVFIDELGEGIEFSEDQIVNNRIIKGAEFSESDFDKIIQSLDEGKILEKMLKYIDYKPRTTKEVINKLNELEVSKDYQSSIIDRLTKLRFLDDERYVISFINEGIKNELGPIAIKYKLIEKGISQELIDQNLTIYQENEIYNNALNLALKTLKTLKGLPINKQKESIVSRLTRMGYSYQVINTALNKITYNEMDLDKLKIEYLKLLNKDLDKNQIITKLLAKGYDYSDIKNIVNELN